jgi:signal-transduction protein with cAMP-binding, CBS, and nucleotidyltransferase domain
MSPSLLEFLSSAPLFSTLTKEEIGQLGPFVMEEEIPASTFVFLEEEEAHHIYILREGLLRAMIGGKLLASIRPGNFFGEIAVLNESFRTGSVYAEEVSSLVKIDGRKLLDGKSIPVDISFRIMKELIKPLISLHYTNDFYKRTRDIIKMGESDKVEFKSTLRYNLYTGKFGREIEHASLKSIAAFLNTWGGILLIGVDDKQNITGIEPDKFENDDKALLHLTQMISERMGTHFMQFISCAVESIDSKKVMRIDVSPANLPAYLLNNNEEAFYVRTGPSTTDLKPSMIYDYIDNRFFRPRA